MTVDYLVASLPPLVFGAPAPLSWEEFSARVGTLATLPSAWHELETQLRNAIAEARGGAKWKRTTSSCSLFWQSRITACFAEKEIARRDELLDRVWWDAAAELTEPTNPLGKGALATYAIRLKIALRRAKISTAAGLTAFDQLTAETRITLTTDA